MIHDQDWAEQVAAWQAGQAAFWAGILDRPEQVSPGGMGGADAWAFERMAAAWRDAGAWVGGQHGENGAHGPDAAALADLWATLAALQRMLVRTWEDASADFLAACRSPALAAERWAEIRALWFRTAERAFLTLLRRPAYAAAQADLLRAVGRAWAGLPDEARAALRANWRAWQTGAETLQRLAPVPLAEARTPGDVIWREGKTSLTRHRALTGPRPVPPVLIAHGLIGRQTMVDLMPDRSLVRRLLAAGVDVHVLDWGDAGAEDAGRGLDHYAGRQLGRAIGAALAASGAERLVLMGICQGGTLAAAHAARWPGRLAGLITAVAPIDFHADALDPDPSHGLLNLWIRALAPEDIDRLIAIDGALPGPLMGAVFDLLNPVATLRKYTVDLFQQTPDSLPIFLAMERWIADRPDLPGALARTWLVDLYQENALVRGALTLAGQAVRLSAIEAPVLNVFATRDHIIPAPSAKALAAHIPAARYRELALPTGHIGTFVSARAQPVLAPAIVEWLDTLP